MLLNDSHFVKSDCLVIDLFFYEVFFAVRDRGKNIEDNRATVEVIGGVRGCIEGFQGDQLGVPEGTEGPLGKHREKMGEVSCEGGCLEEVKGLPGNVLLRQLIVVVFYL